LALGDLGADPGIAKGWTMASMEVWGWSLQQGLGAEPLVGSGQSPAKLKAFGPFLYKKDEQF